MQHNINGVADGQVSDFGSDEINLALSTERLIWISLVLMFCINTSLFLVACEFYEVQMRMALCFIMWQCCIRALGASVSQGSLAIMLPV